MAKTRNFDKMMLSIMVVGATYSGSKVDRTALYSLGIMDVRVANDLPASFECIIDRRPDLIFCNDEVNGVSSGQFCQLLAQHPEFYNIPVVKLLSNASDLLSVAEAVRDGLALPRPYSLHDLSATIEFALRAAEQEIMSPTLERTLKGFQEAFEALMPARPEETPETENDRITRLCNQAKEHLALARRAMQAGNPRLALEKLSSYVWPDERYCAEATCAMAQCWQAMGHPDKFVHYLGLAARHYAKMNNVDKALELYQAMLKINPNAKNPYAELGAALLAKNEFSAASRAYLRSLHISPERHVLLQSISRDCRFTPDPVKTARALCRELAGKSGLPSEFELFHAIIGENNFYGQSGNFSDNVEKSAFKIKLPFVFQALCSVVIHTSLGYLKGQLEKAKQSA